MNPISLRNDLIIAKQQYGQGLITIDDLYKKADDYIATLKDYRKKTGKKFTIPNRAYLIRAL